MVPSGSPGGLGAVCTKCVPTDSVPASADHTQLPNELCPEAVWAGEEVTTLPHTATAERGGGGGEREDYRVGASPPPSQSRHLDLLVGAVLEALIGWANLEFGGALRRSSAATEVGAVADMEAGAPSPRPTAGDGPICRAVESRSGFSCCLEW